MSELFISNVHSLKTDSIIENYGNQKWWQGFYLGWSCSCLVMAAYILVKKK
jgi:hypothetical protein